MSDRQAVPEQSVTPAPVVDVGPVKTAPDRVGICSEHGWWFDVPEDQHADCPEAGCAAAVHVYRRCGLYRPQREED